MRASAGQVGHMPHTMGVRGKASGTSPTRRRRDSMAPVKERGSENVTAAAATMAQQLDLGKVRT
jgi:hypothetical protein